MKKSVAVGLAMVLLCGGCGGVGVVGEEVVGEDTKYNCDPMSTCGPSVEVQQMTGATRYVVQIDPGRQISLFGYDAADKNVFHYATNLAETFRPNAVQYVFGADDIINMHLDGSGNWIQDNVRFADGNVGPTRMAAIMDDFVRVLSGAQFADLVPAATKEIDWWLTLKCTGWAAQCIATVPVAAPSCAAACTAIFPCAACVVLAVGSLITSCTNWWDNCREIG